MTETGMLELKINARMRHFSVSRVRMNGMQQLPTVKMPGYGPDYNWVLLGASRYLSPHVTRISGLKINDSCEIQAEFRKAWQLIHERA